MKDEPGRAKGAGPWPEMTKNGRFCPWPPRLHQSRRRRAANTCAPNGGPLAESSETPDGMPRLTTFWERVCRGQEARQGGENPLLVSGAASRPQKFLPWPGMDGTTISSISGSQRSKLSRAPGGKRQAKQSALSPADSYRPSDPDVFGRRGSWKIPKPGHYDEVFDCQEKSRKKRPKLDNRPGTVQSTEGK